MASCCPVVVTTEQIGEAFYDDYGTLKAFLHSHSYTILAGLFGCTGHARPVEQSPVLERKYTAGRTHMAKPRRILRWITRMWPKCVRPGMILAIEMVQEKATEGTAALAGTQAGSAVRYQHALQQQALLRPLGPVVTSCHHVISEDE